MRSQRAEFPFIFIALGTPFIALGVASPSNRSPLFVGIAVILGGLVVALIARERR
jgi:hypothetical protein